MELMNRLISQVAVAQLDTEYCTATNGLSCGLTIEVTGTDFSALVVKEVGQGSVITLHASSDVWRDIMLPKPPIGYHSFTAALRQSPHFKVDGSPLHIAQSLHALERLFEILRGQVTEDQSDVYPDLQQIHGHYARLRLSGETTTQIYYDQSGNINAPTLLMLHTAGADARQFHPIMADTLLQQQWNMIAFDMPSHGRSMPLSEALWQDYRLLKKDYVTICQAFITQIVGKPSVLLGCSMGAAMALKMAAVSPELVAGVIALEAPFRATGRRTAMLANPEVNQTEHNPSYVRGLMSPTSSLASRRVAAWIYSQGGFQIYSGDLAFYSDEFDASVDLVGIDGVSKGISLLTGSYDYSATPADSEKVAQLIPGAHFTQMPDLGHFPMIENPKRLMDYLKPELDFVSSKLKA